MSAGNVSRRLTQGAIIERIEQHLFDEYSRRFADVVESSRQWLNSDGLKLLHSTAVAATASIGAARIGGVQHAVALLTRQGASNKKRKVIAGENASYSPVFVFSYDDVQTPRQPQPQHSQRTATTAPCTSTPLSASKRPVSRFAPTQSQNLTASSTPAKPSSVVRKLVVPAIFTQQQCPAVVPVIKQATAANAVTPIVHGPVKATPAPVKAAATPSKPAVVQTSVAKVTAALEPPEPGLKAAAPATKAAPEPTPIPNTEKPPKPQAMSPPSTVAASSITSVDSDSDSELTASSFDESSIEADSSTSIASMSVSGTKSQQQQPALRRCPLCNGMIPEADFHAHIRELKCKAATPAKPQQTRPNQTVEKEAAPQPQPPPPKPEPAPKSTAVKAPLPAAQAKPTAPSQQQTAAAMGLPAGVFGAAYSKTPQQTVVQMPPIAASVLAKPPMPIPVPQLPPQLPSSASAKLAVKKTSGELMPPPKFTPTKSGKKSPAPNTAAAQQSPAPAMVSPPTKPVTASQEMASSAGKGYEISVCHDSESDYDSEEEFRRKKHRVPMWAKGEALSRALAAQENADPDAIFQCSTTSCDLSEIFSGMAKQSQRQRYRNRTSSGNWQKDKFTLEDVIRYKNAALKK